MLTSQRPGWLGVVVAGAALLAGLAGCASERLNAASPAGVNLSGRWRLNVNLSDDPDRQAPTDSEQRRTPSDLGPHGRRGNGPGGPLGPGPVPGPAPGPGTGSNYGTAPDGLLRVSQQAAPVSATANASAAAVSAGVHERAQLLRAPPSLSIVQQGSNVSVQQTLGDGSSFTDTYQGGFHGTISYADGSAERTVGWRGPVLVVTTNIKGGGSREDDFAIDEDGRLIMTLQTRGARFGKNDLTRVYDRLRP